MGPEPYARGGCHSRNNVRDTKLLTILVSDISRSDSIPMPMISACAASKVSPLGTAFLAVSTDWTGSAGVALLLQDHLHAQTLCLIGEQVPCMAMGPLMETLVIWRADIHPLPNIFHIAYDDRLDPLLIQGRDHGSGLFVLDILDLVLDRVELLLLGGYELFSPL